MTAESSHEHALVDGEVLCITGGPRSGKTTALVERAAAWGRETSPDGAPSFLFFCASPAFIGAAEALVAERDATGGLVTTPYDYALRILAHPRARALTGRSSRALTADEQAVFFEDLKTSGLKRRRLRELWAFFLCGLANLDDGDPAWIQTTEERAQLDLARDILRFEDAMLPGEVVNRAVRALEADAALREAFAVPVVLADDFPLMSRASQRLAELLARENLAVAGDETPLPPAFEPYPNPAGMSELRNRHRPVQLVALDEPFRPATREWRSAETLSDEMRLVASIVAEELAAGSAPASIAVASTNKLWRANLLRALQMAGIPAIEHRAPKMPEIGSGTGPGNDPRAISGNKKASTFSAGRKEAGQDAREKSAERAGMQRNTTEQNANRARILCALAADPSDSVAWRQWLAQNDALARSAAVSELRCAAAPEELSLAEALERLAADTLPGLAAASPFGASLLSPYREALELIQSEAAPSSTAEQAELPAAAGPEQRCALSPYSGSVSREKPPVSAAGAENASAAPVPAVTVCGPRDLIGRTFDVVIFGGFVNGFIPSREMCDPGAVVGAARERALAADRAALNAVTTRAARRVLFTGFSTCDLETAERLKLHVTRIRLKDGQRQCTIEPSTYLEDILHPDA